MTLPPDIAALLGGGASSAPGAAAPPDPSQAAPSGGGDESKPIDLLKQMIELGKQYLDVEPDDEDKATMTDVLNRLQQYLAKDQQDQDKLLQGNASPRALRKASGGSSPY